MAILDAQGNAVVIRVVYDGAPFAGKTTSVGALGRGLGASVHTPAEIQGRTLYFDWLDYTGGLFEGHRVRCQIVSAPGQRSLAARRRRLLESADVVVFVGDSSPAAFETDHSYLRSLGSVLRYVKGPPVGIVLQANKRDLPDAVPIDRMRAMLDECDMKVGIVETVAKEGTGVREAFVFAVRLALDRVRELMQRGQLARGKPSIDSAEDLLADLQRYEEGSLNSAAEKEVANAASLARAKSTVAANELQAGSLAAQALEQALRVEPESAAAPASRPRGAAGPPALPSESVASGLVWPPVDGRVILQEVASSGVKLKRLEDGAWYGRIANRWHVRAPADAIYDTVDQGRPALIALARAYTTKCSTDSIERCAVLAGDGAGRVRLWRIKRIAR